MVRKKVLSMFISHENISMVIKKRESLSLRLLSMSQGQLEWCFAFGVELDFTCTILQCIARKYKENIINK